MRRLTLILTLALFSIAVAGNSGLRAQQGTQQGTPLGAQQEAQQPAPKRHLIAVFNFTDTAADSAARGMARTQVRPGRQITGLLIARLVSDGIYQVMEPGRIQNALKEQSLPAGNLSDAETAAKIGHLLGADAVVTGQITQFGVAGQEANAADEQSAASGPGGADAARGDVVVAITAQIIDTNTGQIIASTASKGVSKPATGASPSQGEESTAPGGATGAESRNLHGRVHADAVQTLLSKAMNDAVNALAKGLESENARLSPWAPPPLSGEITNASTPDVAINVGSAAGLKVGDEMLVTRMVHVVTEEGTQSPVGTIEDQVGVLTITRVQEYSAVGRFSGTEAPKIGDLVKPLN